MYIAFVYEQFQFLNHSTIDAILYDLCYIGPMCKINQIGKY